MPKLGKRQLFIGCFFLVTIVLTGNYFFRSSRMRLLEPDQTIEEVQIMEQGLENSQTNNASSDHLMCPLVSPHLSGPVKIRLEAPPTEELEKNFQTRVQLGGRYSPPECRSRYKVAIIVPFMNREKNLPVFLQHMHDFLPRQQINYTIYVVQQAGKGTFNKGMMMNAGVIEALKQDDFQCFIFHDVDLLPEDDRNFYSCSDEPLLMAVAMSTFNYKLPYGKYFGGVIAMSKSHVQKVNGFSNLFWGWGCEDDDMYNRVIYRHLSVAHYPASIARYTMLPHKKSKVNPRRFHVLHNGEKRSRIDGLSSLRYKRLKLEFKRLYTWILVEIPPP